MGTGTGLVSGSMRFARLARPVPFLHVLRCVRAMITCALIIAWPMNSGLSESVLGSVAGGSAAPWWWLSACSGVFNGFDPGVGVGQWPVLFVHPATVVADGRR